MTLLPTLVLIDVVRGLLIAAIASLRLPGLRTKIFILQKACFGT